jgi:adenylate kinase family enzyme
MNKVCDKWIENTTKKDLDTVCIVYGREGVGKSTLAIILAHHLMKKQGRTFNVARNTHYNVSDFQHAVFNSQPGDVQVIDESILFSFSREAMSKENRKIVQILATCRSQNQIILFCIPNIHTLDKYIREHRVACGLEVHRRGGFKIWPKPALNRIAEKKPHDMKSIIFEKFPSVQEGLSQKIWDQYLTHKHNKVRHETKVDKKKIDTKYVRAKYVKDTYDLTDNWLAKAYHAGKLEAITLPGGHRRYSERGIKDLLGL